MSDTTMVDTTSGEVIDPEQLMSMLDFPEIDLMQSPTIGKLLPALIDAQAKFDPVLKDRGNEFYNSRYATLQSVLDAVKPALAAGRMLLLHQTATGLNGKHVLFTRIMHESGEWIGSRWTLSPVKNDPQGEGSALTYARRYQVQTLLSVATEDDDGNAASRPARPAAAKREWLTEAEALVAGDQPATDRRIELLKLMEECERAHQMTPALNRKFVGLGQQIAAQITPDAATG